MTRVAVIGLGYIGLPTASVLADAGMDVLGVDIDPDIVGSVNQGKAPFAEPGLDTLLARVQASGKLRAACQPAPADVFVISVPTPVRRGGSGDPAPDLSQVKAAVLSIAPCLSRPTLVILESTVPIGTTETLARWLAQARPDLFVPGDVAIAHCPERVLPGRALTELASNDRVIGGLTPACAVAAARTYGRFVYGRCHLTSARAAEMAKLAENAFRDVNVAFANELALIADGMDIDVREVIRLANRHPRVDILQPGPGVGGHCIAVDPWFLAAAAPEYAPLIRTARGVNDGRPAWTANRARALTADLAAPVYACFGLAFKANVGDLRESPALAVARNLSACAPGRVLAVEPHIQALPSGVTGIELTDARSAMMRADLALLLVDHDAFRPLRPRTGIRVLDMRGLWQIPDPSPAAGPPNTQPHRELSAAG